MTDHFLSQKLARSRTLMAVAAASMLPLIAAGQQDSASPGAAAAERTAASFDREAQEAFVSPRHDWRAVRTYVGVNQPLLVDFDAAGVREQAGAAADAAIELELLVAGSETNQRGEARDAESLASQPADEQANDAGVMRLDLAERFPVVWTRRGSEARRVLYVQPVVGGERAGAPFVIEPQLRPREAEDGLTSRLREAVLSNQPTDRVREFVMQIIELAPAMKQQLVSEVVVSEPDPGEPVSGVRLYERRDIVLETELGRMVVRVRPDVAPETSYRIVELAEGGWYDGVIFHRIVPDNGRGFPFVIQGGDPTGTGRGGPGFSIDFESTPDLPHDFGVVSMARQGGKPNSNGSQFFICLSREGCRALDGGYVAFGEVVEGGEVIAAIASVPVRGQSPLEPPTIERAYSVSAEPVGSRSRVTEQPIGDESPVQR